MNDLYKRDFYGWTQKTAQLLKDRKFDAVDWNNLIEEVESLGRKEKQELRNRLAVLLGHLLKWQFQAENRSNSWLATIREQREQIQLLFKENPSLKIYLDVVEIAYRSGVNLAVKDTELPYETFPSQCPYTWAEIVNSEFFPVN